MSEPAEEATEQDVYAAVVAAVVKQHRERLGLSQRALALQSGVPQSTLSRVERGQAIPDAWALRALGAIFHPEVDGGASAGGAALQGEIDRAFDATMQWAEQLPGESTGPWWVTALKVAATAGLVAIAGMVVAGLVEPKD